MLKFKRSELENGIRVLTELHPQSHAVSIGIWVLTGTRDEKPGEEGLAHFLEHLVFKGTKTRTAYQIARSLESLGGELNAFTTREHTCYHALVLKDHWFEALDVLSDLVCNMSLSQKDFRLEKGVVLAEIASSNENNEEYVYDFFFERVFANHSLGRPILGTVKSISEMTQKQVRDYYRRHYSGGNIIVSAAGHIDHEELVSGVRKLLRNKKKVRIDRGRKPPRWRRVRAVLEKPSEQVHFLIGLPTTSFKDRFRFEAWIINALLGGGMTSRLFQSVRERKGLVYSVHSSLNSYEDCGQMLIYAATDAEKVQELTEVVTHELKKLKRKGVTRGDVDLFKTQVKGALLLGSDDVENRMHSLAVNEIVFGHYRSVESVIEEIDQITADSVNQFLDTRFNTKQVSGVLLGEGVSRLESWWKEVEF